MKEWGTIISLKDGVAEVDSLANCGSGEVVYCRGNKGITLGLFPRNIAVAFLSENSLCAGLAVFRSKELNTIQVIPDLFSNVINGLGELQCNLDMKRGNFILLNSLLAPELVVDIKAPGIITRQSVYEPLPTGTKIIDSLIPVGLGQRELIIGDRKTGKTTIALDAILNQLPYSLFY